MPAKEELSPEVAFPALGVVICESCARELVTLAPFAGRDIRRRDAGVGMGMLIVSLFDIKLGAALLEGPGRPGRKRANLP